MSNDAAGYNGGTYDFRQQTFCMSMLTCLSFNLTGRTAENITTRFRTSVENVLNDEAAKALIGNWKLVWGPVIYADAFVGAKASVNSMFIAAPAEHPDQVVVAIAGTNGNSLVGWMIQDFNVKDKVPWPFGSTELKPHLSKGIAFGLEKLLGLAERGADGGAGITARDYLAANPSVTKIMVTGHSLGGALAGVYSLYLDDTRSEWVGSREARLSCLATAGQTPGDADFSRYYGEKLGDVTSRVWNAMDIVPHAYQLETLRKIPAMYVPQIAPQKPVQRLIDNLCRETGANGYVNILPQAESFPSTFLRLEDIAGEKYRVFIDFINNVVRLIRRRNLFRSKDVVGTLDFAAHALIQHIFPYFTHFGIGDFIKIMCDAAARPSEASTRWRGFADWLRGLWARLRSVFSGSPSS